MRDSLPGTTAVLLFVKAPVKGRVKTRLAAQLGDDAALKLYRGFVLDILDTIGKSGHPCRICFHPPDAGDAVAGWLGRHRRYLPQEGSDLGARMANAFAAVFSQGASQAVLVGSDIPDLPADIITGAIGSLKTNDAVIGPAHDGGYYLVGFRKETFLPEVFRGIEWSTERVLEQTMQRFERSGCRVHRLPQWRDVDTVEDLQALAGRNKSTQFRHSRTMKQIGE